MKNYFNLFSNCIPVKGFKRSIICDLQMNTFEFIPNELYHILKTNLSLSISEIKKLYKSEENIIQEYFDFLVKKEFGFLGDNVEAEFVPLNLEWDSPHDITNAIIDIDANTNLSTLKKICSELDFLNCVGLELRVFDSFLMSQIDSVLQFFKYSTLRSIVILLQSNSYITLENLELMAKKHPRLMEINISNSEKKQTLRILNNGVRVNFLDKPIDSEDCCGYIRPEYFDVNVELFTEALRFNTCLNRKISIDRKGNIKNCPSMKKSYGNIEKNSLINIYGLSVFKEMWFINKDQIDICKDCEFRYICTDCRKFTKNNSLYSKPSKCNYDPYNAHWN